MPTKRSKQQPTDAELTILKVLWDLGPSTVRRVHETLQQTMDSKTGYTTVLKLMQIMAQKGSVDRDESSRSHVYSAVRSRETTQQTIVGTLIDKTFSGSTAQLVLSALSAKPASAKELDEIRAMLNAADSERRGSK
jgi:BlaI family penicillinase repressor